MLTLTNRIDMRPGAVPLVIHLGQYDSDFSLVFELYSSAGNFTVESGTTAMIRGTKTDGHAYDADATINISAKTVTVAGSEQMTAAKGRNVYELVLTKSGKVLSTANFILDVERAAMDADTIASESVLKELNAIIAGAETATEAASNAASAADRAEDAAESVSSASAQIATNTNDISDLKADLSKVTGETRNLFNLNNLFVGYAWNGSVNTARACAYIPILGGEEYIISFPTATASRFDAITAFEKVNISDTTNLYLSGISSGFERTASPSAKLLGIQFTKTEITKADLDGLVFQVEYGNKTSPFIQNETATDLIVRNEMVTFITPEMFGAWGDGVHDDTVALQDALNTGKNVVANGKYLISASLVMTPIAKIGQRFEFNKIVCSTNNAALILNGRNGYIDGLYLESNGDCVWLGNSDIAYDWYIHIIWAKSNLSSTMVIGGGGNVSECTIIGERFTYYLEGIHFTLTAGFVGQNRIIGVAFECISDAEQYSGWAFTANGTTYPMTGLSLFDVSLEGAHGGFNFANSRVDLPINPLYCFGLRTSELTDVNGYKLLRLTGNGVIAGDIFGDIINLDSIDVSLHNPNIKYEQSFNFHGRLKWKGQGWRNARIVGNKIVPTFVKSVGSSVNSPTYDETNLPFTTNLISGSAVWNITFPFDGEIVFISIADGTTLTVNGSQQTLNNTQTVKVRTELWQNPDEPSDIRTNVILTKPDGTQVMKTLS